MMDTKASDNRFLLLGMLPARLNELNNEQFGL